MSHDKHENHQGYEDIYDALRAAIQALGGAKQVAGRLWGGKPIGEAHRDLLDALNRDRPRKLDPDEVLKILSWAREIGFHSAKHFIDATTGYEPGKPLAPENELAALLRQYLEASRLLQSLQPQIEELRLRVAK